jgi:hypothetical protein
MFTPDSRSNGEHAAFEYPGLMADSEAGARGEAVKWASGRLTKASGTDVPAFILQAAVAAANPSTARPPCLRVDEMQAWHTTMGAVNGTPAAVVPGSLLTIHTDGLTMSYVVTNGIAEVKSLENTGNAVVGDELAVVFRR